MANIFFYTPKNENRNVQTVQKLFCSYSSSLSSLYLSSLESILYFMSFVQTGLIAIALTSQTWLPLTPSGTYLRHCSGCPEELFNLYLPSVMPIERFRRNFAHKSKTFALVYFWPNLQDLINPSFLTRQ